MPLITKTFIESSGRSASVLAEKAETASRKRSARSESTKPRRSRKTNSSSRPIYMYAKYPGNCACGSHIGSGDMICYDGATRQALCMPCGKEQAKVVTAQKSSAKMKGEGQKLFERFEQLKALPRPVSEEELGELSKLEAQLNDSAQRDAALRAALLKARVKGSMLAIVARYAGKCSHCGTMQNAGEPVAYDTEQRSIICCSCVPVG